MIIFINMKSLLCALLLATAYLSPALADDSSAYGPITGSCPSTPLVRDASAGLNDLEASYIRARKTKADDALAEWLYRVNPSFVTSSLPTIALAHSGGGYRALLSSLGLFKGLDARDSDVSTSGLLEAITYQAGLSGGAWMVSAVIGNDHPTVSSMLRDFLQEALDDSAFVPVNLFDAFDIWDQVEDDLDAKEDAGFDPTIVDLYGRMLAFQFLTENGWDVTLSEIVEKDSFTSFTMPFPIITALGWGDPAEKCVPDNSTPTFEFTPYEFGSWEATIAAFTQTKYLGSNLTDGVPGEEDVCVTNYDKLAWVLGSSSNIWNMLCAEHQDILAIQADSALRDGFWKIVDGVDGDYIANEYAIVPNPFYDHDTSTLVKEEPMLFLVDGAETERLIPLVPLLQPARGVNVVIAMDNSADVDDFPDGRALLATQNYTKANGLTRMPVIPENIKIKMTSGSWNKRPAFFGCHDREKVTIVYLPNMEYTFASNLKTEEVEFDSEEVEGMIENGLQIASKGGDEGWAMCLGCVFLEKTVSGLPEVCEACWKEYCFGEED